MDSKFEEIIGLKLDKTKVSNELILADNIYNQFLDNIILESTTQIQGAKELASQTNVDEFIKKYTGLDLNTYLESEKSLSFTLQPDMYEAIETIFISAVAKTEFNAPNFNKLMGLLYTKKIPGTGNEEQTTSYLKLLNACERFYINLPRYKEFEDIEQEIFLNKYYNYEDTEKVLFQLSYQTYNLVRENTKEGIKEGVDEFLHKNNAPSLYKSNLNQFSTDESIEKRVKEKIDSIDVHLNFKDDYAKEVSETYRLFIYNESLDRFRIV